MKTKSLTTVAAIVFVAILATFTSCTNNSSELQAKVDSLQNELKKFTDEKT